jgi:hypothetical protein
MLCMNNPWDKEISRLSYDTDLLTTVRPPATPEPFALTLDNGTHCRLFTGGARRARSDGYVPVYACGADLTASVLGDAGSQTDPIKPLKAVVDGHIRAARLSDRSAIRDHRLVRGHLGDGATPAFCPGNLGCRICDPESLRHPIGTHIQPSDSRTAESDGKQLLMKATPRLLLRLPVRLVPGRPNMPELQGYPLHPFRLQEGHRRGHAGVCSVSFMAWA